MEVKPGYRQTEVGLIPEDWEVRPLGEFASIAAGGTPSREVAAYWDGNIPWVTTAEINFNAIRETDQYISQSGLHNSAAKLLRPGTLLMALYGQGKTRGKIAVLEIEATSNQACAAISVGTNASRHFVFHYLAGQYEAIRGLSNSGGQENLSGQIVKALLIPLPPTRPEQVAIAGALSDADALIESLEQLVAKKRQIKHGAMQELLTGQKRLPGFTGEWETKRLKEVATSDSGGTPSISDPRFFGGEIPWVAISDMTGVGKWVHKTERTLSALGLASSAAKLWPAGTILYAMYASIGECAIAIRHLAASQAILGIRPHQKLDGAYLYYTTRG